MSPVSLERRFDSRPIVLVFVRYYLPGFKAGGPLRTIENMVTQLGHKFDFRIVTLDRDIGDSASYKDVPTDAWQAVGSASARYLSPSLTSLLRVARLLRETPHDILYLNSFFDPDFALKPLLARLLKLCPVRPCVIAPRGEFSEGALRLKGAKKRAFIALLSLSGTYANLTWQASTEFEKSDIMRVLPTVAQDIYVARDLAARPSKSLMASHQPRAPAGPLRISFLSRISPMKNLSFALETLKMVRAPVRFDIYGPDEDRAYWAQCLNIIDTLPPHVRAVYHGPLDPREVSVALSQSDLFFLPTMGENFGHVIAEALSAGTPLLISDQTPWRGLQEAGIGWDLPLNGPEAFARVIDEFDAWQPGRVAACRQSCYDFAESFILSSESYVENEGLFLHALSLS